jgi:hypothetical protein
MSASFLSRHATKPNSSFLHSDSLTIPLIVVSTVVLAIGLSWNKKNRSPEYNIVENHQNVEVLSTGVEEKTLHPEEVTSNQHQESNHIEDKAYHQEDDSAHQEEKTPYQDEETAVQDYEVKSITRLEEVQIQQEVNLSENDALNETPDLVSETLTAQVAEPEGSVILVGSSEKIDDSFVIEGKDTFMQSAIFVSPNLDVDSLNLQKAELQNENQPLETAPSKSVQVKGTLTTRFAHYLPSLAL